MSSEHEYPDHDYWSESDLRTEAWLNGQDTTDGVWWGDTTPGVGPRLPAGLPTGMHVEEYTGNRAKVSGRIRLAPISAEALEREANKLLAQFRESHTFGL